MADNFFFQFQFTPLREGRRAGKENEKMNNDNFNSRPYARGDILYSRKMGADNIFQFTPLREGRQQQAMADKPSTYFNSRPYARGD